MARLSRIYSVAVPTVLFCVGLGLWLAAQPWFVPERLNNFVPVSWWDTLSSLLFLNQSWMNNVNLTLNNPYWSLNFEVWFYVIFGAWYFARGRTRWLLVGCAAALAGPAIILLFPIWLIGAWLAASGRYTARFSTASAWLAFILPLMLIVVIRLTNIDLLIKTALSESIPGYWRLMWSQRFVTDYVIGAALCLHIAAFSSLPLAVKEFFALHQKRFAGLAGFSFTLYLFHWPMTQVWGAYFPIPQGAVQSSSLAALAILLACWAISWGTERRLNSWRRLFSKLLMPSQVASAR